MVQVLLAEGVTDLPSGPLGDVVYMRSGVPTIRARVMPVVPSTADQLAEVSRFSGAARQWAYELDASERASWNASSMCDVSVGYWLWVWLGSLLGWVEKWIPAGAAGGQLDAPVVSGCGFDPVVGTVGTLVTTDAGSAATVASVAVSRPLRPGRRARRSEMRIVQPVVPNVATDLTDSYVAKFGRLPLAGQMMSQQVQVASTSSLGLSCPVIVDCVDEAPSTECSVELDNTTVSVFDQVTGFAAAYDPSGEPFGNWGVSLASSCFNLAEGSSLPNGSFVELAVDVFGCGSGTFPLVFILTADWDSDIQCEFEFEITVEDSDP